MEIFLKMKVWKIKFRKIIKVWKAKILKKKMEFWKFKLKIGVLEIYLKIKVWKIKFKKIIKVWKVKHWKLNLKKSSFEKLS